MGEDTRTKLVLAVEKGMTEQQVLGLLGPLDKPSGVCTQGSVRAGVIDY